MSAKKVLLAVLVIGIGAASYWFVAHRGQGGAPLTKKGAL
jgi:hypothetical protein